MFDIYVPALRERLADIPLLTEHVLAEFAKAMGRRPARLADDARDVRLAHDWPGNIRELRNVLEAATILSDDGIIEPSSGSIYHGLSREPDRPRRTISARSNDTPLRRP